MSIFLDASAIDTFLTCREQYRQKYVENREPGQTSIHLVFGSAVHKAVELWHKGSDYAGCLKAAAEVMEGLDEGRLDPPTQLKWRELALALPEVVAAYCDGVEPAEGAEVEQEWSVPFQRVTLCGKIDRYHRGVVYDVKTASEIGRTWKSDYRSGLLRSFQFGLYDWYKREEAKRVSAEQGREWANVVLPPLTVKVECLVKPYRGKPARLEVFDLPDIAVYRRRFEQQLAWVVTEITRYHEQYLGVRPWPMASHNICLGKFSACDYLPVCNGGETPKVMERYREREEHLVMLKEAGRGR